MRSLGIIGAGTIGQKHAAAAQAVGIPVAMVADQDLERARELAETCEAVPLTNTNDLLCNPDVTAVIVCVPNAFHAEYAIRAMQEGKDVLLEKPMGMDAAECDRMIAAAEESRRMLQIALVHRYTSVAQLAHKIAAAGELGDIYHAKAHLYQRRGVPGLGRWFTNRALSGGGCLIDLGVHLLDLVQFVWGHPQVVSVAGQVYSKFGRRMKDYVFDSMWAGPPDYNGTCDVEDSAHALIRFADGRTLDLQVTWAANYSQGALPKSLLAFMGDQAGMTFELFGEQIKLARVEFDRNVDVQLPCATWDPFERQLSAFAEAVESRVVTGATGSQGRCVQAMLDAIYRSSREQMEVPVE